jgi:hypothetical protein
MRSGYLSAVCAAAVFLLCCNVHAKNTFGIGVIVGEPTGLSLKSWLSQRDAFDVALAWDFHPYDMIHVHADYLLHNFSLIPVTQGQMPVYFGIGGFVGVGDVEPGLGFRIPFGVSYIFSPAPVDVFLELVPALRLITGTHFDFQGGIGVRYWF